MLYFSYGSNMSERRLRHRIRATRLGVAELTCHALRFHKLGHDGTAKCDAWETGDPRHRVLGVVFDIEAGDKPILDRHEGLHAGYEIKHVDLVLDGREIRAFTYYATRIDASVRPLHWYKQHVLYGARESALPETYIRLIEQVESIEDSEPGRHHRELAIYR